MNKLQIIEINDKNIDEHGCYCLMNKKRVGYSKKIEWVRKRSKEGLIIKMLYSEEIGYIGFIEYIPGNYSWRAFSNPDYMFIHCIYIAKKRDRQKGYGKILIDECTKDAKLANKKGIATIASGKSMLAEKDVYIQNGFEIADTSSKYNLLVKRFVDDELPRFKKNRDDILKKYKNLTLIYTNQCPYFQQAVEAIERVSKAFAIKLDIIEVDSINDIREIPSIYGVFNLIYKGQLIAEHYISEKRFRNILEKELNFKMPS